jgi:hypothetical protein
MATDYNVVVCRPVARRVSGGWRAEGGRLRVVGEEADRGGGRRRPWPGPAAPLAADPAFWGLTPPSERGAPFTAGHELCAFIPYPRRMDLRSLATVIGIVSGILAIVSGGYRICARRRQAAAFSVRPASAPGSPLVLRLEHVGAEVVYQLVGHVRWFLMSNPVTDQHQIRAQRLAPGESMPIPVPISSRHLEPMRFEELAACADYVEITLAYALVPRPRHRVRAQVRVSVTHLGADHSPYHHVKQVGD